MQITHRILQHTIKLFEREILENKISTKQNTRKQKKMGTATKATV
jgi:hypothetical protein